MGFKRKLGELQETSTEKSKVDKQTIEKPSESLSDGKAREIKAGNIRARDTKVLDKVLLDRSNAVIPRSTWRNLKSKPARAFRYTTHHPRSHLLRNTKNEGQSVPQGHGFASPSNAGTFMTDSDEAENQMATPSDSGITFTGADPRKMLLHDSGYRSIESGGQAQTGEDPNSVPTSSYPVIAQPALGFTDTLVEYSQFSAQQTEEAMIGSRQPSIELTTSSAKESSTKAIDATGPFEAPQINHFDSRFLHDIIVSAKCRSQSSPTLRPSEGLLIPCKDQSTHEFVRHIGIAEDETEVPLDTHNNVQIPICVSFSGPPENPVDCQKGVMVWNTDGRTHWNPKWVMEPDVERIKEAVQSFWSHCGFPNADITVEYLAGGSWNKAYTVSSIDKHTGARHECIFRVALPVMPWYKVQSEVATMEYVRINTTIPVPRVYAFDSSMNNAVGLEWILMEKIQGESYRDVADYMSTEAKLEVQRKIAEWVDQLSKLTFDGIGSLYCQWDRTLPGFGQFKLGPIVHQTFMPAKRAQYEVFHGPYGSLAECYHALLEVQLAEANDPETKFKVEDEPLEVGFREEMRARELELRDKKLGINHRASQIRKEAGRLEDEIAKLLADMSTEGKVDVETGRWIWAVVAVVWNSRDRSAADRIKELRELRRKHKLGRDLVSRITQLIGFDTINAQVQADALQNENSIAMLCQAAKDHEASRSPTVWSGESLDDVHRLGGLHKAISHIIGQKPLGPNSTYLRHWDISESNVMVGSYGQAAALIDWEQIIMVPLDFNSGLPGILDGGEHSNPPPWPVGYFKTEDRLEVEEMYENTPYKRAFMRRLRELKSPILDTLRRDSEEMGLLRDVIEDLPGHSYEWYELNILPMIKKKYEWKI